MSVEYDRYLAQHIENVQKGYEWLRDKLPEVFDGEFMDDIFQHHDASKTDQREYGAYDAYFYGPNKSYKVVQEFKYAWLRHIHMNPHHWQYWVLINDDPDESVTCLEMPRRYIIEMICDWWSFSWAGDNLMEIFNWWSEHAAYIMLNPKTRKTVIDILGKMKNELEKEFTLEHHGIKGMHWGVRRTPEQLAAAKGLASDEKTDTIVVDAIKSGEVSTKVNSEKQLRHTKDGHTPGRSYIDGDLEDAQQLIDELGGTGTPLVTSDGRWLHKERVSADATIGVYADSDGNESESSNAMIVYSKNGAHIYPRKGEK